MLSEWEQQAEDMAAEGKQLEEDDIYSDDCSEEEGDAQAEEEADESEGRRRFTVAHEIGHWVCQCDEGRVAPPAPIMCRHTDMASGAPDLEREANHFAASLLMPEAAVRQVAAEGMGVNAAAAYFGVSDVAMHWRFFNLALGADRPQ